MSGQNLSADEIKVIKECIKAAAYGPFFIDEEAKDNRRSGTSALLRRILPPEGEEEPAGTPRDGRRQEHDLEVDLEVRASG